MLNCYLVCLKLRDAGVVEREAFTPVGTLIDRGERDLVEALPHIEVVAKRTYHRILSEMDDPVTMEGEFHRFVYANKVEQGIYGAKLLGFFPVTHNHRTVGRSHTEDRIASSEAYLVFAVEDNHEID